MSFCTYNMTICKCNHMQGGECLIEKLKALSDENRLRLLHLLSLESLCVCELEVLLNMNQSNVSRHLNKLKTAGVITAHKEGLWVHYQLEPAFYEQSPELLSYLKKIWAKEELYLSDYKRYETYKQHGLSCRDITEDKGIVLDLIKRP